MRRLAGAAGAAIVAACIVGCGSTPAPSPPPGASGFVEVQLEIAPDARQFFASQHRGRVIDGDGSVLADWEITDGASPVSVPVGRHQLQAFTVFLSDFIQCSTDPGGASHCAQPTLGPAQVCTIPIEVVAGETVEARYQSLPEGRCELVGGAAAVPTIAPNATDDLRPSLATGARLCAGTGWSPLAPDVTPGLTASAIDRSNLAISNATARAWSYRLSGWEAMALEDCQGLVEVEIERGTIPAGVRIETTFGILDGRLDLPVTLGWWDGPCGEACTRLPVGGVLVERSAREPASS